METADATEVFDILSAKYEEQSKQLLNPEIKWNRLPDKKQSHVTLTIPADFSDQIKWDEQFTWLYENLVKFFNFFKPKVMALDK